MYWPRIELFGIQLLKKLFYLNFVYIIIYIQKIILDVYTYYLHTIDLVDSSIYIQKIIFDIYVHNGYIQMIFTILAYLYG